MSETWRGSGGWGYWQGAPWRQKGNKQNGKQGKGSDGKEQPSLPTFPAYDNKKGGTAVVQLTQTSEHIHIVQTQRRDDTMVKDLQRTLNLARKAETKVMKIQGDLQERKRMWAEWERQLKQCYTSEKRRHAASLESLGKDLLEAMQQQDVAREEVRRVASGHQTQPMELDGCAEDTQFAALMEDDAELEAEEDIDEDVLQRALQAANVAAPATPKSVQAQPRTPYPVRPLPKAATTGIATIALGSNTRMQPFPPPKPLSSSTYPVPDLNPLPSPVVAVDPYQELQQSQGSPALPAQSVNRVKSKATGRTSVKEQSKPSGPVGRLVLAHSPSKVEELRAAETLKVMGTNLPHQTRVLDTPAVSSDGGSSAHVVPAGTKHFILQDDDGPPDLEPDGSGIGVDMD